MVDERLYISAVTEAFIFGPWFDRSGVATSANALAVPELDDSNDSLLGDPNAPWYVDMSKLKDRTFFDFPTRPHFVASVAVAYDMDGYITSRLSTVPNTDYSVPAGIDLTTVEMLTFFPGYLKDPFFLYRCVSVGWDSKGLEKALWTHRNQDYLPFQTIKENIIHTMMALTGIQDYGALASINHVALWQRSKFEDYTSAAFARSRDFAAGELPEATDLRLSDLSMNVTAYPQNEDAGMLTALVQAYGQGKIQGSHMSGVAHMAGLLQGMGDQRSHGAKQDRMRPVYWNSR